MLRFKLILGSLFFIFLHAWRSQKLWLQENLFKNVSAFVFVVLEHFHIPPGLGGMWFNKKKNLKLADSAALMRFGPHPARRGVADRWVIDLRTAANPSILPPASFWLWRTNRYTADWAVFCFVFFPAGEKWSVEMWLRILNLLPWPFNTAGGSGGVTPCPVSSPRGRILVED